MSLPSSPPTALSQPTRAEKGRSAAATELTGVHEQPAASEGDAVEAMPAPLSGAQPSAQFVRRVPIAFARSKQVLGLAAEGTPMRVAMVDLDDAQTLDVLRRWLGVAIEAVAVDAEQLSMAINQAYGQQTGTAHEFVAELDRDAVMAEVKGLQGREDLLNVSDRAPVIKLVNLVLFEAVQQQASDIHVQPFENRVMVRMRIDGVLFDVFNLPGGVQEEFVSRVKVMGKMNIAEKRLPQDGRATVQVGDRVIDLRVSTVPTSHGERVVIRLLDKSVRLYTLNELGMDTAAMTRFSRLIRAEHGLVLVTGPTGSGKSTTLYAALGQLDATERNIITLEDPIEYQLEGISQIQVSEKKGMTFASGLRSVLRQDPDVVMIGEIRDRETAVMAIQAALTGHLVFSTLHTNNAASAVTRLLDLGIEPYLVGSSLIGVLAQRLVRSICEGCGKPYSPEPAELEQLHLDPAHDPTARYRKGIGCASCRQTGYQGRLGCFELLVVDDQVRRLVQAHSTASEIDEAARQAGMHSLSDDALRKVAEGRTSLEEVMRVSMRAAS
ncbi:MAG: type II secretion system ATPase GspE [Phycisphaeraceae bacterium]